MKKKKNKKTHAQERAAKRADFICAIENGHPWDGGAWQLVPAHDRQYVWHFGRVPPPWALEAFDSIERRPLPIPASQTNWMEIQRIADLVATRFPDEVARVRRDQNGGYQRRLALSLIKKVANLHPRIRWLVAEMLRWRKPDERLAVRGERMPARRRPSTKDSSQPSPRSSATAPGKKKPAKKKSAKKSAKSRPATAPTSSPRPPATAPAKKKRPAKKKPAKSVRAELNANGSSRR